MYIIIMTNEMAEEMTMAKQMNVNMQLLDLEMRVLARMVLILLYERSCKKCYPCKKAYETVLPLLQNETETFYEKCIETIGQLENDIHKYRCFMCIPIEYTCKNCRKVMTDPDLSMFIFIEYIDLMLRDYIGISQHQFFGLNIFNKESVTWEEINPNSLEASKFAQKLLSYVLQKSL